MTISNSLANICDHIYLGFQQFKWKWKHYEDREAVNTQKYLTGVDELSLRVL